MEESIKVSVGLPYNTYSEILSEILPVLCNALPVTMFSVSVHCHFCKIVLTLTIELYQDMHCHMIICPRHVVSFNKLVKSI